MFRIALTEGGDCMLEVRPYDFDEELIESVARDRSARVRCYNPPRAVVIGRGGSVERELFVDRCAEDRIPVLRRRGGGCAVVLDEGNLIVSVVLPWPGISGISRAFELIGDWIIAELSEIGIAGAAQRGTSDLAIGERKVGGSCIYRRRNLLYYTTTLLISPRFDLIERYLRHPPREPDYRRGRSHGEFLTSLERQLPDKDPEDIRERLVSRLGLTSLKQSIPKLFAV